MSLSERWIQSLENVLDQIKHLEEAKERDRLELVRSLHYMLSVLQSSVLGWLGWVNACMHPIITRFLLVPLSASFSL